MNISISSPVCLQSCYAIPYDATRLLCEARYKHAVCHYTSAMQYTALMHRLWHYTFATQCPVLT
eukprot:943540-Rhodomonas_salina.1